MMTDRVSVIGIMLVLLAAWSMSVATPGHAQESQGSDTTSTWSPPRRADGQPDIQGMWNSVGASHIPLETPQKPAAETVGNEGAAPTRGARGEWERPAATEEVTEGDLAYAPYWFDTFWATRTPGDAPALVVEPASGRIPGWTPEAEELIADTRARLHDSYEYMESGDRCITRGIFGMMMPTAYNNGTLIIQTPGYVVLHSEMIHNARIIPVDDRPHLDPMLRQWDGDPRGRWEGNTLVVESTNFKAVRSMRGASALIRSRQSERQRIIERFAFLGPDTLKYSLHIEDPNTYTAPWTVSFPLTRDEDYVQYEYACHEGNYSVPNALRGARVQEGQEK